MLQEKKNILKDKGFDFAVRIVKLAKLISADNYIIGKQILRAGTAVGALVCEAEFAQSRADFINKMSIALKEANETFYWIRLLQATDYINEKQYDSLSKDIDEIISLLVKSIKTTKNNGSDE
jgi:four helix bundle protein